MSRAASRTLPTRVVEKPWGRDSLPPPFAAPAGRRIGEIWFDPPAELPDLLVKYIFTSEALSVQVHPSDAQTGVAGLGRQGKEECWLIVDAVPDARIGIGFVRPLSLADLRAAALNGSIMDLIAWHPARPGDFFSIPANTVHAIGAGIGLIEVQQNSDITYRLYDYGRDRPLHLEEGLSVARREPYPSALHRHVPPEGEVALLSGPLFHLERIDGPPGEGLRARIGDRPALVIARTDGLSLAGVAIAPGACGLALSLDALVVGERAQALLAWK